MLVVQGRKLAGFTSFSRFMEDLLRREVMRASPMAEKLNSDAPYVEIVVRVPRYMALRLDELASRLRLPIDQVTLSALGSSVAEIYLAKLNHLADDLEDVKDSHGSEHGHHNKPEDRTKEKKEKT